jgi:uncharacterized protein
MLPLCDGSPKQQRTVKLKLSSSLDAYTATGWERGWIAVYWLERAAEKNTPRAINALGELYLGHRDVPQDFAVARGWFLRGAQIGNSASMYNLGVLYALGQGVVRDDIEAFKWLELAADMGIGEERDKALRARTRLAERLTPVEVSWGEARVEDWSRARLSISVK